MKEGTCEHFNGGKEMHTIPTLNGPFRAMAQGRVEYAEDLKALSAKSETHTPSEKWQALFKAMESSNAGNNQTSLCAGWLID